MLKGMLSKRMNAETFNEIESGKGHQFIWAFFRNILRIQQADFLADFWQISGGSQCLLVFGGQSDAVNVAGS